MNKEKTKINFFGEEREYSNEYKFNQEWNLNILANSKEEAIMVLKYGLALFEKTEEVDYRYWDGHFMAKKIN